MKSVKFWLLASMIFGVCMSCKKNCEDSVTLLPQGFSSLDKIDSIMVFSVKDNDHPWVRTDTFYVRNKSRPFIYTASTFDDCANYSEFYHLSHYGRTARLFQYFITINVNDPSKVDLSLEMIDDRTYITVEPFEYDPQDGNAKFIFTSVEGAQVHFKPDSGVVWAKNNFRTYKRIK